MPHAAPREAHVTHTGGEPPVPLPPVPLEAPPVPLDVLVVELALVLVEDVVELALVEEDVVELALVLVEDVVELALVLVEDVVELALVLVEDVVELALVLVEDVVELALVLVEDVVELALVLVLELIPPVPAPLPPVPVAAPPVPVDVLVLVPVLVLVLLVAPALVEVAEEVVEDAAPPDAAVDCVVAPPEPMGALCPALPHAGIAAASTVAINARVRMPTRERALRAMTMRISWEHAGAPERARAPIWQRIMAARLADYPRKPENDRRAGRRPWRTTDAGRRAAHLATNAMIWPQSWATPLMISRWRK